MTGIYVNIQRENRFERVEIDQMTDQELEDFAKKQPRFQGWKFAIALAKWVRDHVEATGGT
jgi:hypothetical protein